MGRSWTRTLAALHLLALLSAAPSSGAEERDGFGPERARTRRDASAPSKISCELSSWSQWSSCQPCQDNKYRSRAVIQFGQFGGRPCTDSLYEGQPCPALDTCQANTPCDNGFSCTNGRCIHESLACNDDDDCGDYSDEDECVAIQPTCRGYLQPLSLTEAIGSGVNVLGREVRARPLDNERYNGRCDTVMDGTARRRVRLAWNIPTFIFQTQAQQQVSTEVYETSSEMVKKLYLELTRDLSAGSTSGAYGKAMVEAGIEVIWSYNTSETHEYIRVKGQVELARFKLRSSRLELSGDFIWDLKGLPIEYDKGAYFKILEDYGTHYASSGTLGGKYQMVYVLNKSEMRKARITTEHLKGCLSKGTNSRWKIAGEPKKTNPELCGLTGTQQETSSRLASVIQDVVALLTGGDVEYLTKLKAMLSAGKKPIDGSVYIEWVDSLVRSPALIKPTLQPISALVPLTLPHSPRVRGNLDRALGEYLAEYDVCKCQPCRNGGTTTLLHGRCLCLCPPHFQGDACQTAKNSQDRPGYTDGVWGCWGTWSVCQGGQQRRQRQCRGQQGGGATCLGENTGSMYC
ncbi:complement component C9-like [Amblyraja radiata]|uniref:complement component C9-like n=1 Tax=Amblyraja radiata TaxID=386614 RepID=UPI00140284C0|nr:complement component C9-like [Amblyraja radiata]